MVQSRQTCSDLGRADGRILGGPTDLGRTDGRAGCVVQSRRTCSDLGRIRGGPAGWLMGERRTADWRTGGSDLGSGVFLFWWNHGASELIREFRREMGRDWLIQ